MKFNKAECWVLHCHNSPGNATGLGQSGWRAAWRRRTWACWLMFSGTWIKCVQVAKKSMASWLVSETALPTGAGRVTILLYSALERLQLEYCFQFQAPRYKKIIGDCSKPMEFSRVMSGSRRNVILSDLWSSLQFWLRYNLLNVFSFSSLYYNYSFH